MPLVVSLYGISTSSFEILRALVWWNFVFVILRLANVVEEAAQPPDSSLCPFFASQTYLAMRPQSPHFVSHFDGVPGRVSNFNTAGLKRALRFVGLPDARYSSHSFCIGAATSAAMADIPGADV